MHDNLESLSQVMGGLDKLDTMTTPIQLVEIDGRSTIGTLFNLTSVFNNDIVAPLQKVIDDGGGMADANAIATKIDNAIVAALGTGAGKSSTVVNNSPDSSTPELHLTIADSKSLAFTLNLGDVGDKYGIKFADQVGTATLNFSFDLDFKTTGLTVPLFNGDGNGYQVLAANSRYRQQQYRTDDLRLEAEERARIAFQEVANDARRSRELAQAVEAQQRVVQSRRQRYAAGVMRIVDVLNSERDLYQAQRSLLSSRYNYLLNMMQLKRLTGDISDADIAFIDSELAKGTSPVRRLNYGG